MSDSDYGVLARLLHRLALNSPAVAQFSFDLESVLAPKLNPQFNETAMDEHPVFITGLARAGTTILMRTLYGTGQFRSLTYRDMPFVLMPNIWKKLSSGARRHEAEKERAHGDSILVSFDSPEAFEEVFWRSFCSDDYILKDGLHPHHPDQETLEKFRQFVRHTLISSDSSDRIRYLSKNNNNILRLASIKSAFPNAAIIILFRNPIQHAISLHTQHARFRAKHLKDNFSRQYMTWLAHHEFGLTHKPFTFSQSVKNEMSKYTTDDINYWLSLWQRTYQYLFDMAPPGSLFICYEELCNAPARTLKVIFEHVSIEADTDSSLNIFTMPAIKSADGIDTYIERNCNNLYKCMAETPSATH